MSEIKKVFVFDRLVGAENFCNFEKEKSVIKKSIKDGTCLKIYGPRNFGKTSLIKNIIAKEWMAEDHERRIFIYADLFSVQSLDDISDEIVKSFTYALNSKKNILEKSLEWMKALKHLRPTWSPPTSPDSYGEFSVTAENHKSKIYFSTIFENINLLNKKKQFEFLIVLDEFQEIAKIKKAEALLRGALQLLDSKISVVILGSKQHLLAEIFERPRAPFYAWGNTIEIGVIEFGIYTVYINERFKDSKLKISNENSERLQKMLNRIPEAINRFCDYLNKNLYNQEISEKIIQFQLEQFVEMSRSTYELTYSSLTTAEQKLVVAVAKEGEVSQILGKDFLFKIPKVSKSTVSSVLYKLLDHSIISQTVTEDSTKIYWVTDPFFATFARRYKG